MSLTVLAMSEGVFYMINRSHLAPKYRPITYKIKENENLPTSTSLHALPVSFRKLQEVPSPPLDPPDRAPVRLDYSRLIAPNFWRFSESEGLIFHPNTQSKSTVTIAGTDKIIYDVIYKFDAYGRRETPVSSAEKHKRHLILLGCSFVFGVGLDQERTLAALIAQSHPTYKVYNEGMPSSSPTRIIQKINGGHAWEGINPAEGIAVYVFIDEHIHRAIGAMNVVGSWGANLPHATERSDGSFEVLGSFASDKPLLTAFYQWLWQSELIKFSGFNLPMRFDENHLDQVARMILQIKEAYLKNFPGQRFVVASYPGVFSSIMPRLNPFLEKYGIDYLDYSGFFMDFYSAQPLRIPYDGHPNAEAIELWEKVLSRDLKL